MNWQPDLELRLYLDGRGIEVTRPGRSPAFFVEPIFNRHILPITVELYNQIGTLFSAGAKSGARAIAQAKVEAEGDKLFNVLFSLWNDDDVSLAQILGEVLRAATEEGRIPTIIVHGAWYSAPWELIRIPPEHSGLTEHRYLGELAIVAALLKKQAIEQDEEFISTDPLQLVTWSGEKLSYLNDELRYVSSLSSPYLRTPHVVNNLPGTKKPANEASSVGKLMSETCLPFAAKVLHCACHSECPSAVEDFKLSLHKQTHITAPVLLKHKFGVAESNIGFFNTCHAFSTDDWHGGGVARYALTFWRSRAVVASGCLIDDLNATEFAKEFLGRVLPLNSEKGEPLGRALFDARNALMNRSSGATIIGLCYRLLGSPQIRIRVGADALAA